MDIKDVENLAELARLELTEEEKKELLSDMDSILGYVRQIERSDAELPDADVDESEHSLGTVPQASVKIGTGTGNLGTGTCNVWREDEIVPREFSKEIISEQFPNSQDGFLKVKKIL